MITPDEVRKKMLRIWDSGDFLKSWCDGKMVLPLDMPAGLPGGRFISANFQAVREWINRLVEQSKEKKKKGYSIRYEQVSHRQLGRQSLPDRIIVETPDDFLYICGKQREFDRFIEIYNITGKILPGLACFLRDNPLLCLDNSAEWERLLRVCLYFIDNPTPGIYIRQIVISGIDSKFIEKHKKILSDLLLFLMPQIYGADPVNLSHHGFEKRFGLLYDQPVIRFRILDSRCFINSLSDISLTLREFAELNPGVERIFITENKINGLAFPMVRDSMVIFGLGYGIKNLENIHWMKSKEIYYWGDIDTHGFGILSMVRGIFPRCMSLLMDEETLLSHRNAWVAEPEKKPQTDDPDNLTEAEQRLYNKLKNGVFGEKVRLEQELINYDLLKEKLAGLS